MLSRRVKKIIKGFFFLYSGLVADLASTFFCQSTKLHCKFKLRIATSSMEPLPSHIEKGVFVDRWSFFKSHSNDTKTVVPLSKYLIYWAYFKTKADFLKKPASQEIFSISKVVKKDLKESFNFCQGWIKISDTPGKNSTIES